MGCASRATIPRGGKGTIGVGRLGREAASTPLGGPTGFYRRPRVQCGAERRLGGDALQRCAGGGLQSGDARVSDATPHALRTHTQHSPSGRGAAAGLNQQCCWCATAGAACRASNVSGADYADGCWGGGGTRRQWESRRGRVPREVGYPYGAIDQGCTMISPVPCVQPLLLLQISTPYIALALC